MTNARRRLDNWKFWTGIAYFGLAATVVWLFFLNQTTARQEADRAARNRATKQAQVTVCSQQALAFPIVKNLIAAIDDLATNSILSSEAALDLAAPDDPLNRVRRQSLHRARVAHNRVMSFLTRYREQTPTFSQCVALAKKLGAKLPTRP